MDQLEDIVGLQHTKLDINDIVNLVSSPKCGAISTFIGTTRDNFESKSVLKLEYEAYEPMALKEMRNLCAKIRSQCEVHRIAIFHRLGEVPVSEASVVIAISSFHRKESLEAVHQAIDILKATVPIWKKEIYANEKSEWKENKECSWSSLDGSEASNENVFQNKVKIETSSEEEDVFSEKKYEVMNDPSFVQVRADPVELNRRIQAFIARKREQVNLLNVQEFCFRGDGSDEKRDSCARVDAILTRHNDSKSHMKVHRVLNPWGPQTTNPLTLQKTKTTDESSNYPPALEERLSSTEKLLGINKPVPRDIYERLKSIEDRVSYLESISPEYRDFWAEQSEGLNTIFKSVRKRTFSSAELDLKLQELEDRYAKKIK